MTGARVLAVAGTVSALTAMWGGALLTKIPWLSSVLLATAPGIMLLGNLAVIVGGRRLR